MASRTTKYGWGEELLSEVESGDRPAEAKRRMSKTSRRLLLRNNATGIVIVALLAGLTGSFVLTAGKFEAIQMRRGTGYPQLISIEPLPEIDGASCPWGTANVTYSPVAALQHSQVVGEASASNAIPADIANRKPLRVIRDPYSSYSAVAVDPVHNEVVMADENLFKILTYDRLENTSPKAQFSEPKRIIEGLNTEIEFECALYVDPANGDIYAVNNDTLQKLVVFSHDARGNVAPDRYLNTPHSTYGIAIDEKNREMLLTISLEHAVATYSKFAKGHDVPIRSLAGVHTLLADPHGIAFDPKNDVYFVSNWGNFDIQEPYDYHKIVIGRAYPALSGTGKFLPPSITVYPRNASGDTAPLRVISGPKTQLNWPSAMAVDPEHGELYVVNDPADSVTVFKTDANGDVAPIRVIKGPKTLVKNPTGVYVDVKNDELWVANFGNHTATVFKRTASGDTPPLRVIRSGPLDAPAPMIGNPHTLAYDTKRDELLVAN